MHRPIIHNIQLLRFLAAGGVLCSHAADLLIPHDRHNQWFWAVPWTGGVDIFFVISGFIMVCLTHDKFGDAGTAKAFLIRRIIRIAPPYWLFTSLMVLTVLMLGDHVKNTSVDAAQLATSYGFIPWPRADGKLNPILSQGWTLNYEAFFYLCFAASMLFRRGLLILAGAFVLLVLVHPLIPETLFVLRFWSDPWILEFLAGIGLARIYLSGWRISALGTTTCVMLAVAGYVIADALDPAIWNRFLRIGIPVIVFAAGFMLAREPRSIGVIGRLLRLGGDASYTLYLSHTFTIHAVILAWASIGRGYPWLVAATAMIAAILFAVIFYLVAERPLISRLQQRFGKRRFDAMATVAP